MQGVEILTSAQVAIEWAFNCTAFWITFFIIFGFTFIIGIISFVDSYDWTYMVLGGILGVIFGCIVGVGAGGIFDAPIAYETQYKVTISDEVSMTEFLEHYEVIDQDGKIFTVREKTNEEH